MEPETKGVLPDELMRARIGEAFWPATFDQIPKECSYREPLGRWLEHRVDLLGRGVGLYLYGQDSTGKTSAACIAGKAALSSQFTVLFTTAMEVRRSFSGDKAQFDEMQDLGERIRTVGLLILDDWERGTDTVWGRIAVEEVLRYRVRRRKATIVTSRIEPQNVKANLGVDMWNPVRETMVIVECRGHDWREAQQDAIKKEFTQA